MDSVYCFILFSNFFCAIQIKLPSSFYSFIKFSDVLPAFLCARATVNLWTICLGVNILSLSLFVAFIGHTPVLEALTIIWVKGSPCLNLVRIMPETWSLVLKYT